MLRDDIPATFSRPLQWEIYRDDMAFRWELLLLALAPSVHTVRGALFALLEGRMTATLPCLHANFAGPGGPSHNWLADMPFAGQLGAACNSSPTCRPLDAHSLTAPSPPHRTPSWSCAPGLWRYKLLLGLTRLLVNAWYRDVSVNTLRLWQPAGTTRQLR